MRKTRIYAPLALLVAGLSVGTLLAPAPAVSQDNNEPDLVGDYVGTYSSQNGDRGSVVISITAQFDDRFRGTYAADGERPRRIKGTITESGQLHMVTGGPRIVKLAGFPLRRANQISGSYLIQRKKRILVRGTFNVERE